MTTISISLVDLVLDPGGNLDLSGLSHVALTAALQSYYAFLGPKAEIALMGSGGLDYTSSEKKYHVTAYEDESFSGLHVMCLMYGGFQKVDPSVDLRLPLGGCVPKGAGAVWKARVGRLPGHRESDVSRGRARMPAVRGAHHGARREPAHRFLAVAARRLGERDTR